MITTGCLLAVHLLEWVSIYHKDYPTALVLADLGIDVQALAADEARAR